VRETGGSSDGRYRLGVTVHSLQRFANVPMLTRAADTLLPTSFGEFRLRAYAESGSAHPHLALIKGVVDGVDAPLVRIHSECMTGDVFSSQRCDCGIQLEVSMQMIELAGSGVLIYLRQEGRGIGLLNKIRAYRLQDGGLDTVEANLRLGFDADQRDYADAITMLEDLGVGAVRLLTNNPAKIAAFDRSSVRVVTRIPLVTPVTDHNRRYLKAKQLQLGHLLDAAEL
jgi:3,4-dihydroxy 2-butanone 4-phosphate synthase / GTP cyclohydrolase II